VDKQSIATPENTPDILPEGAPDLHDIRLAL